MNIKESPTLKTLLKFLKDSSYRCNLCGKTIYPMTTHVDFESERISIESGKCYARGGVGNKILMDNVCPECTKRATFVIRGRRLSNAESSSLSYQDTYINKEALNEAIAPFIIGKEKSNV